MSVAGPYQWLHFSSETAWGTPDETPAEEFWVPLRTGDAFRPTRNPNPVTIEVASQYIDKRWQRFSVRHSFAASLRVPLWPSLATYLIPMACTPVTVSSRQQMSSWTIRHFDGISTREFIGCRCSQMDLESSDDGDTVTSGTWNFVIKDETASPTALTAPTIASDFPTTRPYVHSDSASLITLGGVTMVGYRNAYITVKNTLDARFYEGTRILAANLIRRDVDWRITRLKEAETIRTAYEGQSALADGQMKWALGGLSVTLDLKDANYVDSYDVNRDFTTDQTETFMLAGILDGVAGVSLAATVDSTP